MPKTQVKLATSKKVIKFMGGEYNTLIIDGKVFFIATEINNLLGVGNIHQFVSNHSYGAERCKVHIGDMANRQRLAISTSAMRRFAKKFERPNLIELALKGECEFNMPYPRSVSVTTKTHTDVAKNKKTAKQGDQLEAMVANGLKFIKTSKLQREIADLKAKLATQERVNENLSKLVAKPTKYSTLLELVNKWHITAKTTAQVAAEYGYCLDNFKAALVDMGILNDSIGLIPEEDSKLFEAGYVKQYPKITSEPLWTIEGQKMLYSELKSRGIIPLVDKLNDI